MKEGFFPYVEDCSKLLVPLMTFFYQDGVRMAALSTMPMLLDSTKLHLQKNNIADKKILEELFAFIYPALLNAVKEENDTEVLVYGIESIHECLTVMGENCLSTNTIGELFDLVKHLVLAARNRRNYLLKSNPDGDLDESLMIREELSKEDEIYSELAEVVGTIIKLHRSSFRAKFDGILQLVYEMAKRDSYAAEKQLAICIFDDLMEHSPENGLPHLNDFLPLMLEYALDSHPGVKQASCYGLGVCAQNGGDSFKSLIPKTLEILLQVINEPGSRDNERSASPTENAISSVGKIIQHQSAALGEKLGQLVTGWLSWLPLEVDIIEAKIVHNQLCHFIKTINVHVFGPNGSNLPTVLNIFARIVNTPLVNEATQQMIKEILTQMSAQLPADMVQQAMLSIPSESQHKLLNLK
jgi:hypothetical protein